MEEKKPIETEQSGALHEGTVAQQPTGRQRMRERADQAARRAETALDTTTTRAGERLGRAGEAIRRGSERFDRAGNYLREHTPRDMTEDMRGLIQRHPIKSVLIGMGAGVALSRGGTMLRLVKYGAFALAAQRLYELARQEADDEARVAAEVDLGHH